MIKLFNSGGQKSALTYSAYEILKDMTLAWPPWELDQAMNIFPKLRNISNATVLELYSLCDS